MVTLIAVRLRIRNVILDEQHFHVVLFAQHVRDLVDVRRKTADDPDAGNVVQKPERVRDRNVPAFPAEFSRNALFRLQ